MEIIIKLAALAMLIILVAAVYLFPTLVGYDRRHRSRMAIAALNIMFGWTVLGWAIALIWSLTGNVEDRDRSA